MRFASPCSAFSRSLLHLALGALLVAIPACSQSVPTFPPIGMDAGPRCSSAGSPDGGGGGVSCASGEVCLAGQCFRSCGGDGGANGCGPREECVMGVCRGLDGGGAFDAGPPDPCETAMCMGATPFCRGGTCLECMDATGCGGPSPICDVSRGRCTAYRDSICAPCNTDLDCRGAGGAVTGLCTSRESPLERTCLPTCMGGCPMGFTCDMTIDRCVPALGASCTGFLAAVGMQACETDGDCAPVGATFSSGLFMDACTGDVGAPGVCRFPCGTDTNCPPGFGCDTGSGFCVVR